jgi:hypothetical protein
MRQERCDHRRPPNDAVRALLRGAAEPLLHRVFRGAAPQIKRRAKTRRAIVRRTEGLDRKKLRKQGKEGSLSSGRNCRSISTDYSRESS